MPEKMKDCWLVQGRTFREAELSVSLLTNLTERLSRMTTEEREQTTFVFTTEGGEQVRTNEVWVKVE